MKLLAAPAAPLLLAARIPARHDALPSSLLVSPYPYFGGKSKIAADIWQRLGDVPNFVDPFFGSGSILLKRPTEHPFSQRIETVNDKDGLIANFWRAVRFEPDVVAHYADWPVNENDLHARHLWLVNQKDSLAAKLEGDPDYYDCKIAGWWVWGMALWIGSGFCSGNGSWLSVGGELVKTERPEADGRCRKLVHLADHGQGIKRNRPQLDDAMRGVVRQSVGLTGAQGVKRTMPSTGDASPGVARQMLSIGDGGRGVHRKRVELGHQWSSGHGILAKRANDLYGYFDMLSERLRRVRVCSGDWTRVLGDSPTTKLGITGVVLDPPYAHDGRDTHLYNNDHADLAAAVRLWAIEHGNDPLFRIAYCGYEDDFAWPDGWTSLKWTPRGGFDGQRKHGANNNRQREVVWFSPHCLKVDRPAQLALFATPPSGPEPVQLVLGT